MLKRKKKYYKKKVIHLEGEPSIQPTSPHPTRAPKKKLHPLLTAPLYVGLGGFVGLLVLVTGFFVFIKTHEEFAANFADDTLRPLIGEQSTIQIEAFFFAIQDNLNQMQYKAIPHQTHVAYADSKPPVVDQTPTFPLDAIQPIIHDSNLPGEGEWEPLLSSASADLIAKTVFRPDSSRPYAIATIAKLNTHLLDLAIVAGTRQPGGPAKPGLGFVPQEIQTSNNLVAAFNGGFQQKDGYYGMLVGDMTYLPLEQNMATLVMYKDHTPTLVRYTGQNFGNTVTAIRQNGPMLIENGQIVTSSNAWNMQTWGLTTTNSMYTWRSGVGVTKEGNIVYAAGPSLVPETLANALLGAGAVNAMQLDINPTWVRFNTFTPLGNGAYTYASINPAMVNGGYQYLHGYQKDFFYVYKK